ncbi:MAG: hypothetical protein PVH88_20795 [Ignavibacteria bacterium]|jgi:hypothetical protein
MVSPLLYYTKQKTQDYSFAKLILILIFISGCGVTEPERTDLGFFPLSVGNIWHYKIQGETTFNYISTWRVNRITKISGKDYFEIIKEISSNDYDYKDTSYYRIDNSRVIELISTNSNENFEIPYADFGLNKNKSFNYTIYNITVKVTVVEKDKNSITFYYDAPEVVDEEHSITFEKNKGITLFYNDARGGEYLFDYEINTQ